MSRRWRLKLKVVKQGVRTLSGQSDKNGPFARTEDLMSVLDVTTDGILIVDFEGRILFSNNAANHLLNQTPRDLRGTVFGVPLAAGLKTELQIVKKEGAVRIIEMQVSVLHFDGKDLAVACLRDITDHIAQSKSLDERNQELSRLNEELKIARDRAIELSKLKSQFVANVSHEIRTPLSGILGMAELLLTDQAAPGTERRQSAQCIYSSAQQLFRVLSDILDFSKLEAGHIVCQENSFSIHELLETVYVSIKPLTQKKGLAVDFVCDGVIPDLIDGDETKIRQCLLNLAHNSVKFTSSGSIHVFATCVAQKQKTIDIRFAVQDTGIGVDAAAHGKLFDPFVQADGTTTRKFGGTGLGLSITKRYVELMGGTIGVESKAGEGSTFWFTIPVKATDVIIDGHDTSCSEQSK
jgi:signal transduction histidine kinase